MGEPQIAIGGLAVHVAGHPLFAAGESHFQKVSTAGTALYGQTINWQTGSTGWQRGQITIEPAKPIRNVNVYLLLRGHSGTVWFDDVFVTSAAITEEAPDGS